MKRAAKAVNETSRLGSKEEQPQASSHSPVLASMQPPNIVRAWGSMK
jgi:hypothetical protein